MTTTSSHDRDTADDSRHVAELQKKMDTLTRRVHEKIRDYDRYQFSKLQSRSLNIFFDLAQEFGGEDDLWALTVVVPKVFFDIDVTLYMLGRDNRLDFRCSTLPGQHHDEFVTLEDLNELDRPQRLYRELFIPIKGNREFLELLPFTPRGDTIGLLIFSPATSISAEDELFFEKYANRIGYRLHGRIISRKNREHLQFIRTLVEDIGHNVIVPNMYFKLYYRRLESKIKVLREIGDQFSAFTRGCTMMGSQHAKECRLLKREMDYAFDALIDQYREIYRHYEQTSLFLETLLRRSHFEEGRYVLEMRPVSVRDRIIGPQLDRYHHRFDERDLNLSEDPESHGQQNDAHDVKVMADFGLISQVFANLVSNAAKYAQSVTDADGQTRKFVTYGWELTPPPIGMGRNGVKIYVFSTGPNISEPDRHHLFDEGFRGSNAGGEYGTGHGLSFVREVVALHGGSVEYEAYELGNAFSFTLPVVDDDTPADY
jgi:signal transduction histidine kinase